MAEQVALKTEKQTDSNIFLDTKLSEPSQVQRLTVDIPSDLHRDFKIWCVMHKLKMNELIRDLIRETIKE